MLFLSNNNMKIFRRHSEKKEQKGLEKEVKDDLGTNESEPIIEVKNGLDLKNLEQIKVEPEVKIGEAKPISSKIDDDIKFLSSCTTPNYDEMASVIDVLVHDGSSVKFPSLRNLPLDIKYMINSLKRATSNDMGTLKLSSKFSRKNILENIRIRYDNEADWFIENHIDNSNSYKALSMRLGYDLLAPRKVGTIEETKKFDEKSRKIFKVQNLSVLEKYDNFIIGTGAAISQYMNLKCKIELVH